MTLFGRGVAGGALVVEGEEVGEDLLGGEGLTIKFQGPAVGGEDGLVEGAVGVFQPGAFAGGAEVVELGEGAVFEVGFGGVGRVEPGVAKADEFSGGVGDGFDAGVFGFGGFGAGRPRKGKVSKQDSPL